jgi:pimeloyl-ACP methyl ester carboxylesterase
MNQTPLHATSTVSDKTHFQDVVHDAAYVSHEFTHGGKAYKLEGRILYNARHDKPHVLLIHGARSDYSKANTLSIGLQAHGISVLGMTMSGHSAASPLDNQETSLGNNIREAEKFFEDLDPNQPAIVMGFSLGGTPALKLLEKYSGRIGKIVLFYPGIYDKAPYDKPYGPAFRETISQSYSYKNNDTLALLSTFPGKVMLVHGEYDGLDPVEYGKPLGGSAGEVEIDGIKRYSPIPKEVMEMIADAVPARRFTHIVAPGVDHAMMLWMRKNPEAAQPLIAQIAQFITK